MACEGEDTTVTGLFDQNRQQFFQWYDEAVRSLSLPSQEPLRDTLHTVYRRYDARADEMSKMIRQGAMADAKCYYYDLVRPESDRLRELCFRLFAINQAAMYNAEARTHAIANQTAFGTMIISVVSLVLSIIATVWLIKVFIIPAEELTGRVKQIGGGKPRPEDRCALRRRDRPAEPGVQQDDRTAQAVRAAEHRQDPFGEAEVGERLWRASPTG